MVHLRQTPKFLVFLSAPNNRLSFLTHHDRSSNRLELQSPTDFLPPSTTFTSPTAVARVKILAVSLNPSPSKRRRLLLQESSTESSKSNVTPVAVETIAKRDVLFFISILGIFTDPFVYFILFQHEFLPLKQ